MSNDEKPYSPEGISETIMSEHCGCDNAEDCTATGSYLCNCEADAIHPADFWLVSCPLAHAYCLLCCHDTMSAITSDTTSDTSSDTSSDTTSTTSVDSCNGADPCHGCPSCCGFVYHSLVCSLCLPAMVLFLLGGAVCCCVGCWNQVCGCDDRCSKGCGNASVEPIETQPGGQEVGSSEGKVWTTEESGQIS